MSNLLPVTIGNIFGGSVMVGLVYWLVYARSRARGTTPTRDEQAHEPEHEHEPDDD